MTKTQQKKLIADVEAEIRAQHETQAAAPGMVGAGWLDRLKNLAPLIEALLKIILPLFGDAREQKVIAKGQPDQLKALVKDRVSDLLRESAAGAEAIKAQAAPPQG